MSEAGVAGSLRSTSGAMASGVPCGAPGLALSRSPSRVGPFASMRARAASAASTANNSNRWISPPAT